MLLRVLSQDDPACAWEKKHRLEGIHIFYTYNTPVTSDKKKIPRFTQLFRA